MGQQYLPGLEPEPINTNDYQGDENEVQDKSPEEEETTRIRNLDFFIAQLLVGEYESGEIRVNDRPTSRSYRSEDNEKEKQVHVIYDVGLNSQQGTQNLRLERHPIGDPEDDISEIIYNDLNHIKEEVIDKNDYRSTLESGINNDYPALYFER